MSTLPAPLAAIGPVKARWNFHRTRSRAQVARLSRQHCQACGRELQHPDWAHMAGRRHLVGEPWASSPQLTMGLCRSCHTSIDQNRDIELRDTLRRRSVAWLCELGAARGLNMDELETLSLEDPLAAIMRAVDVLDGAGIQPTCCPSHEIAPTRK